MCNELLNDPLDMVYKQDEKFIAHLERASAQVRKWPKWKQRIIGIVLPEERKAIKEEKDVSASDWTTHLFEWMKAQETINLEMAELAKRIEALETRLAMPADPFGKFAEPDIDSVDYRKDDYQPKHDVTVRRNARPASPTKLIEGWWYKTDSFGLFQYKGEMPKYRIPLCDGTVHCFTVERDMMINVNLNDLAHDVEGIKVWMVEESNSIVMYVGTSDSFMVRFYNRNSRDEQPIARYIATKCGWPIIPDEQMRSLRNESDRYYYRNV